MTLGSNNSGDGVGVCKIIGGDGVLVSYDVVWVLDHALVRVVMVLTSYGKMLYHVNPEIVNVMM